MSGLDWVVLLILGMSILISLMRGLAHEIFSLLAWVMAFLAAKWGANLAAPLLPISVESESLRYFIALAVVFVAMMLLVLLLGRMVKGALGAAGLGGADRLVGAVFGLLRGVVILTGLTLVAGLTALPKTQFWQLSESAKYLEFLAGSAVPLLPENLSKHLHYR